MQVEHACTPDCAGKLHYYADYGTKILWSSEPVADRMIHLSHHEPTQQRNPMSHVVARIEIPMDGDPQDIINSVSNLLNLPDAIRQMIYEALHATGHRVRGGNWQEAFAKAWTATTK